MKNLSLVLNIVLLVAVVVLFYLHFSGGKSATASGSGNDTTAVDLKVAYIVSDSVLKYYDYLKVNGEQLKAKNEKAQQDYRNRALGLQSEFNAYQRNVNSMTLGQVRATEEDLQKKQQNLQMYEQALTQQLMQEEAKLQKALYDRITSFLQGYCPEKGLQVVLKFDNSSDVLYGGKALDITDDVVKGLNEEYKLEGTGAKADTTKTKK
jgi:outer membrane protein